MKHTDARIVAYRVIDDSRPQRRLYDLQPVHRGPTLANVLALSLAVAVVMAGIVSVVMPIANQLHALWR